MAFFAAIWASTALAFFYVAWFPGETALFRFLMIALMIGGIVRAFSLINYPPTPFIIFGIFLETVIPVLMLWIHASLMKKGIIQ